MSEQPKPAEQQMKEEVKPQSSFKHIVRIANIDVQGNKAIRFALRKIKGVGINFANVVCSIAKVNKDTKAGNLKAEEVSRLNEIITNPAKNGIPTWMFNRRKDYESGDDKHILTGTLGFVKENDLKRLKKIKTLRGMRHQKGLPVRGQRTRANFRKSKGKVVGVRKKAPPAKSAKK